MIDFFLLCLGVAFSVSIGVIGAAAVVVLGVVFWQSGRNNKVN